MQRIGRPKVRRRRAFWENALGVLTCATIFVLAGAAHNLGIAEKWLTAIFGTVFPFCLVIFLRRKTLRWSFWVALGICLLLHCMFVFAVFQYVLAGVSRLSPLLWLPVMLIEAIFLLIAVKRIDEKITGRHET